MAVSADSKTPEYRNLDAEENRKKRRSGKFLTFFLKECEYGVEILAVNEIIGMREITAVPQMPPYVLGVINLRGTILPIIDLRLRFGMEAKEATPETSIIVLRLEGVMKGLLVDRVSEVTVISEDEVEDVPSFGSEIDSGFLLGLAKTGDRVRMLLDTESVLAGGAA